MTEWVKHVDGRQRVYHWMKIFFGGGEMMLANLVVWDEKKQRKRRNEKMWRRKNLFDMTLSNSWNGEEDDKIHNNSFNFSFFLPLLCIRTRRSSERITEKKTGKINWGKLNPLPLPSQASQAQPFSQPSSHPSSKSSRVAGWFILCHHSRGLHNTATASVRQRMEGWLSEGVTLPDDGKERWKGESQTGYGWGKRRKI